MTLPDTAEAIYDLLEADEVIAAELGVCLIPGQSEIPAIGVFDANEVLPEGTAISGVEIAILRNPTPDPELLLTGETLLNPMFRLHLSQWTEDAGGIGSLWTALQRILALLPGAKASPIDLQGARSTTPSADLGLLDQYAIRWTNPVAHVVTPEELL